MPELPKPEQVLGSSGWMLGLARALRDQHGFNTFVETGTCYGWTAARAAQIFEKVYTVELDAQRSQRAKEQFGWPNIEFFVGHSPHVLHDQIMPLVRESRAIFWFDAHCQRPELLPSNGWECPLLSELEIVLSRCGDVILLIDDARLFLAPPPKPHRADHWPRIQEVMARVENAWGEDTTILVLADIIVVVPARLELADFLCDYWRDHYCEPTFDWWSRG